MQPAPAAYLRGFFDELRSPRTRQSLRAMAPLAREALFFTALALAVLTIDFPQALWARWLPLPFMTLASVWLGLSARPAGLRWPAVGWLSMAFALLSVRAVLSLGGPLPAEGLSEALGLAVIFVCTAGLWLEAAAAPWRALGHWSGALALGWLTAALTVGHGMPADSTRFLTGFSAAAGALAALYGVFAGQRGRRGSSSTWRVASLLLRADWLSCASLPFFGAALGQWFVLAQQPPTVQGALALREGFSVQATLWFRALLTGWGEPTLARLVPVFAEPHAATLPAWGGPLGFFSRFGLLGSLLLTGCALMVGLRARSRIRQTSHRSSPTELPGIFLSLFFAGLLVGGGPHSALALLVLGGWIALALAPRLSVPAHGLDAFAARAPRVAPLATVALLGFLGLLLSLLLGLATYGKALQVGASQRALGLERYHRRLILARSLDPFDPAIPMALAAAARDEMNATPGWSEDLYQSVLRHYARARALDRYDTAIPLHLSQFQLLCNREDEAFETIRDALDAQPRSPLLVDYMIGTALGHNRTTLALQTIEYGLNLDPTGPAFDPEHRRRGEWWQRYYLISRRLGQGPQAGRALALALSAKPDDPERVRQAWDLVRESQGPAVKLNDDPGAPREPSANKTGL